MGVADDLTTLFPAPAAGAQLGQGTIVTWDAATGHNTVDWAGTTLTDVRILNTAEAITLKPGHVVVLLGQGNSWFIIGRVTIPGDPNFAGASLSFGADTGQGTNFAVSTSLVTKVFVQMTMPDWADEALVFAVGVASLVNPNGAGDFASGLIAIDGDQGPGTQHGFASGPTNATDQHLQAFTAAHSRVYTPASSVITCELQLRSQNAAWAAQSANSAAISAMAIFRSTV